MKSLLTRNINLDKVILIMTGKLGIKSFYGIAGSKFNVDVSLFD